MLAKNGSIFLKNLPNDFLNYNSLLQTFIKRKRTKGKKIITFFAMHFTQTCKKFTNSRAKY